MEVSVKKMNDTTVFPVLALRGLVVFPGMMLQFDVGREKSVSAVQKAIAGNQLIFLTAQKDIADDDPAEKDLFSVGVVAKIKQMIGNNENGVRVFAQGLYRARLTEMTNTAPYLEAAVAPLEERVSRSTARNEALVRRLRTLFEEYLKYYKLVPPDIVLGIIKEQECGKLSDFLCSNINLAFEDKQEVLEELNPVKRICLMIEILESEIQVLSIEEEISEKAKEQIDENQREYFLREQMRAISEELGDGDNPASESEEFRDKILSAGLSHENEEKLLKECDRFSKMPFGSHEASVIRSYLEICLDLPWNKKTAIKTDLKKAQNILDRDHYGLKKVKDRILETLAVRAMNPEYNKQIICLVGPPGVGKTSVAKSIAKATGRKYTRVSLGGVRDESDIVGHRKTYIGSMPGRIIAAIKQAGVKNPLLLLDEVDKMGAGFKGDPSASLLEVLDPEQNNAFVDHFIDLPFDLSEVLFITTANDYTAIPEPLLDRMDVITLPSYTHEEKFQIAQRHLIKKQMKEHGLTAKQIRFMPEAVHVMIESYTKEAGVRSLERTIASVCRKCDKKLVSGELTEKLTVTPAVLEEFLGPKKFRENEYEREDEIGIATGLAWTSVGGETMPIEVAVLPGSGKLELTGSLGDVMKESAKAAVSYIRANTDRFGIESDFHTKKDIHLHVPEGAIPKDGPSAGITIFTALCSALCGIPIKADVAMTGEITLRGRILPIGGLAEKSMAAYRAKVKTVLIPMGNEPDLSEIDPAVKEQIVFVPVKYADEALSYALIRMPKEKQSDTLIKKDAPCATEIVQ